MKVNFTIIIFWLLNIFENGQGLQTKFIYKNYSWKKVTAEQIDSFYLDTSVFGGMHDEEFKMETRALFNMVRRGEIICVFSDLSELELENAPL